MQIYLGAIEVEQILFCVLYTKCFTIKNQDAYCLFKIFPISL